MNRATLVLVVGCLALAAANLHPGAAPAQVTLTPRVIQIDQLQCSELLARTEDQRERVLVYFNGYVDGMRRQTTWDERAVAAMIERAIADCRANPVQTILSAFTRAAR